MGDEMDLDLTAARFVDAMPTLQHFFLTTCGHTHAIPSRKKWSASQQQVLGKWLSSKAWRVVHDTGDIYSVDAPNSLSCLELSGEVAERISDKEDMHLSLHEEVRGIALSRLSKLTRCRPKYDSAAILCRGALQASATSEPIYHLCCRNRIMYFKLDKGNMRVSGAAEAHLRSLGIQGPDLRAGRQEDPAGRSVNGRSEATVMAIAVLRSSESELATEKLGVLASALHVS